MDLTIQDVLSKYPMELVKILNVPLSSVEKILNMACSSVQIQPKTVYYILYSSFLFDYWKFTF